MLPNNHRPMINKLAQNTIRTNKGQFRILFVTVVLSAFMLFSVFSMGITYLDMRRLQDTRLYGAEYDIVLMNGFTEEQRKSLLENPKVQTVGTETYAGHIKSTEFDETVEIGLLWCDETFWEKQSAPAREETEGHYPIQKNEIMVTKEVLKSFGKEELEIGDSFLATYENNTGIHTEEFTISGIWDGFGHEAVAFVSRAFYEESGYELEYDGILHIKLCSNFVIPETIEKIQESLDLSERQVFQVSYYIENSLKILAGTGGLCLIIGVSAYLLIYNVLYLSVSGRIRYYGLLQALGMTKKQLAAFIRKQMLRVGISGMIAGTGAGILTSFFILPYVMEKLGISMAKTKIQFYPGILLLSVAITGAAILCAIRSPLRTATGITPLEATKYRGTDTPAYKNKKRKGGSLYWRMAKDQMKKDKKKTAVVFLSLAAGLMVFYCLTTIICSQGERTVYPNYWNADFILLNSTTTTEEMDSLQPAIDEEILNDIRRTGGVAEVHALYGIPVMFPYREDSFSDQWIRSYVKSRPYLSETEVIDDYRKNPSKYYGMMKGIDEAEFDYLNTTLGTPIDKQDFLEGRIGILQYSGYEIPDSCLDSPITFQAEGQTKAIRIEAVSYGDYYGASRNIGANVIVSEEYLNTITNPPQILGLIVKYEESYDLQAEKAIKEILEKSPYRNDISYQSKYEDMKTIQDSQGSMFELGVTISMLLLFVGMLNYTNTITGSVQSRKLTFSIMESVGMSRKQMMKLLVREGIIYAAGSVLLTLTVGTGITYIVFQSMNYMNIPFTVPVVPVLCAVVLVTMICMITPVLVYKKTVRNRSVVERLRDYE